VPARFSRCGEPVQGVRSDVCAVGPARDPECVEGDAFEHRSVAERLEHGTEEAGGKSDLGADAIGELDQEARVRACLDASEGDHDHSSGSMGSSASMPTVMPKNSASVGIDT
jgi:hypothetical protein